MTKLYTKHSGITVPKITGAGGGSKGGGTVSPNSLFSTDVLFIVNGLGEGPFYRINPNGPQDIQIANSTIDDLIKIDGDGSEDVNKFKTTAAYGTTTQDPLPSFGDVVVSPQVFASAVKLKKGNIDGVPSSSVTLQETSSSAWDALRFNFVVDRLFKGDEKGNVKPHSINLRIQIFDYLGAVTISDSSYTIQGKTDTSYKLTIQYNIASEFLSEDGYRFSITKTSDESDDSKIEDSIVLQGWDEVQNTPQAYPRTALIGYAIKAADEHTGGVPSFTSLAKALIVKVPSNYNQPILESGEIDWRQLEVGVSNRTTYGYRLQQSGTNILYSENPCLYTGTWDGTFVYSWTQNPVWILYDILTNKTYGLGIEENLIDKYKFYQVGQYCDSCNYNGIYTGVSGLSDGSFRYKPLSTFTSVKENQIGLAKGTPIDERRFILDVSIDKQSKSIDSLNKLSATFRSMLVYSGGKITLASDIPDEYPVMLFNDATIKQGTFKVSGTKESSILTGVDVTYLDPTNHFKREVVRIDSSEANDGSEITAIENIASIDMPGVTRRSQAMRAGQYHIASSKYLKRNITFETSTDALSLSPGDVIAVSSKSSGVEYGFSGRVVANSAISNSSDTNVTIEHFTVPAISSNLFTANNNPLAMRVIKLNSDRVDLYIASNTNYGLFSTGNTSSSVDMANVSLTGVFDPITKSIKPLTAGFYANNAPSAGDLWSFGEFENPGNYFSNKSDKLFKVTNLNRDPKDHSITVSAIEYISNVYVDSDTFINYEPTAYIDVTSPFSTPPAPNFTFTARPRAEIDGSVTVDGVLETSTEKLNYGQQFATEYYISFPDNTTILTSISNTEPLTISALDYSFLSNGESTATITGKSGFTSDVGVIRLLCNNVSVINLDQIKLTIEGLSSCYDNNFDQHVLEVNDGQIPNLRGTDKVSIPVVEKADSEGLINFIGYNSRLVTLARDILSYDLANNSLCIEDTSTGLATLSENIPAAPFYITIDQILAKGYYNANSFFVTGSENTYVSEGLLTANTIDLDFKPRKAAFVRLFIDGVLKKSGYTVNTNANLSISANIQYAYGPNETNYRIEIDSYSVPIIEVGDSVQVSFNNVYSVIGSSYDPLNPEYNTALTANSVYKITLASSPTIDLSAYKFVNISANPSGTINNVSSNTFTFDYDSAKFPGSFNLVNSAVYTLSVGSNYEKLFLTEDSTIKAMPLGTTSVKARNRNVIGRLSPFIEKSITIAALPIQKVQNVTITESLYREQNSGVSVRCTVSFDHIIGQEVTDYEISYKLESVDSVGSDDGGSGLTSYNTVKVPATGVGDDNKIRFTINGINRGDISETNAIDVRITPLNKSIRGITANASKLIVGKTSAPRNIFNFTGGQQTDQITLLWAYERINGDLADLDLKEIVIKRIAGTVEASVDSFLAASPLVVVSAGSERKSIPIDVFGEFTYLARTRDTSGNYSENVVGITITTSKPQRTTVVAAYNEDDPSEIFAGVQNSNSDEYYFPSFSNSNTSGLSYAYTSAIDNANGSSSGWAAIALSPTDLLADSSAYYITQIRDFGQVVTGSIGIDVETSQEVQSTFNDQHEEFLESVSEPSWLFDETYIPGDLGALPHSSNNVSFRAFVQFPEVPTDGCLFEAGGSNNGTYLGLRESGTVLRLRTGSGILELEESTANSTVLDVTSFPKDNNYHAVSWDINTATGSVRLWINNNLSGTGYNVGNNSITWSGNNPAGFGQVGQVVPSVMTGEPATPWPGNISANLEVKYSSLFNNSEAYANVLLDSSFTGIGNIISSPVTRYDSNNKTIMTGPANGNVWGIWNHGQYTGDVSNANSYALIAGIINANAIALGASYHANGVPTGGNAFANITSSSSTYTLVNFTQYSDTGSATTFSGDLGALTSQISVRTSAADSVYYANGNVNVSAFVGSSVNEGFVPYEAGTKTFRHFQIKYDVVNKRPDEFDFTLDKFRYTVDKEQTVYSNTVVYSSSPTTVDYASANFTSRPVISYTVLDQINAESNTVLVVTTAASNQQASFKLFASDGSGEYPANSSANIMITAIGV